MGASKQGHSERRIGIIDLGDGSYVRIAATPDVDSSEALDWAEELIKLQRYVLSKRGAVKVEAQP